MNRAIPFLALLFFSCQDGNIKRAINSITSQEMGQDIMALSSDSLLGRAPFTVGEERTVAYLQKRMAELKLTPAFEGSYIQSVPMVSITTMVPNTVDFTTPKGALKLKTDEEICLWSPTIKPNIKISSADLVFAGFGIDAPEYEWNDFAGLNVSGKIIVVLVNDPGFYTHDSLLFTGNAMTYYGRWRYKFEEAERKGALGCLIVHEDAAAGYPWAVAGSKSNTPILYMDSPELNNSRCVLNGWITLDAVRKLMGKCGYSYDSLKQLAVNRGFKPVGLKACLSLTMENRQTKSASKNVAGYIAGSKNPEEFIVYTAHWDHLGIGKAVDGDSIYNGASDNAAGIAWMLSIAKAFQNSGERPERSVLFLSPTAEESGLFGSTYFVQHPPQEVGRMVACFNYDVALFLGKFSDVTITGPGHSNLDSLLRLAAKSQNRYVISDPNPEIGMIYRSDQLPFLKAGIPSMFAKGCIHQTELGKEKTQELINKYWLNTYHKPSDEFDPTRDNLDGLVEDARLFYDMGNRLTSWNQYPKMSRTSEFYKRSR
ncbi:MAG: M28 family peptidase [Bacteroidales bacterium]|nr:M28 family peptidase [Bacteroidales bacterium]